MRTHVRISVLVYALALFPVNLQAEEIQTGFRPVSPYVFGTETSLAGLEYDIISAALAVHGHTIKPVLMPLARLLQSFKEGHVQAAAPIQETTNSGGFLSESYIHYQNIALTLESANLRITSVADLCGLSIAAFQTARLVLGPEFAAIASRCKAYTEHPVQNIQIRLLFTGRVQVIVGDRRILYHLIRNEAGPIDTGEAVREWQIFDPTLYSVAFRSERLRDDFNYGLAEIRRNGTYRVILDRYGFDADPGE